jgi:hypothetical protein
MCGNGGVAAKRRDLNGRIGRFAGKGISRQENSDRLRAKEF